MRRDFAAGSSGRLLANWNAQNISLNADLYRNLDKLRARSRDLCKNNDYAKRFLGMVAANVVGGTGVGLQARIYDSPKVPDAGANSAVERAFSAWSAKGVCDVTGRLSFRQLQVLAAKTAARDGEALVRIIRGSSSGNAFGFALQVLSVDRIDTQLVRAPENGRNEIKMGVEIDAFGRAVAYHLRPYHPGELWFTDGTKVGSHIRVPASDVIHLYMPDEEAEQLRGLPWMHAAMVRLNHLGAYEEAAVIAARVGAAKMGFFTTPDGKPPGEDGEEADGVPFTEVEPGAFGTLPQGVEFAPFNPDYPHQMFEQFVKANLRGIASGMGVAYHALANDLTNVSFSSIRSGTLEERDQWMAIQAWFVESFLEPIYAEWIKFALAAGQVKLDNGSALSLTKLEKFSAHIWQPRRWQWVDPKNDMEANILAVQEGFKSRQQICAELGVEFEDVLAQLKAEKDMAAQIGVELGAPKPVAPPDTADPADTAAATGDAVAKAISAFKPAEVRVESPVTVNSPVSVQTPDVNNTVEAHFPEMSQETIDKADAAAQKAAQTQDELARALEALAKTQADTARALHELRVGMVEKLDHVARGVYADRVPVFDTNGDPVRSRLDLKDMH